tara:strand:- start:800 stop:937 length:138 start_codon:yes stop_codon:yes gene_type:complete
MLARQEKLKLLSIQLDNAINYKIKLPFIREGNLKVFEIRKVFLFF